MPLIQETAYPRLETAPSTTEVAPFTPTPDELTFVISWTRRPGPRLALLIKAPYVGFLFRCYSEPYILSGEDLDLVLAKIANALLGICNLDRLRK